MNRDETGELVVAQVKGSNLSAREDVRGELAVERVVDEIDLDDG